MVMPGIGARIEKAYQYLPSLYKGTHIGTFVQITVHTCIGQIVGFSWPIMFLAHNVIDLTSEKSIVLMDQAIFA